MRKSFVFALVASSVSLLAAPAFAHTGAGTTHGFGAGLLHPVGGFDHTLAMLSVGIWSALSVRSRVWLAPLAFVAVMLLGAVAGYAGMPLPAVEIGIAASVVLLGLMILARVELPTVVAVALVGAFALFHGHAHGTEVSGALATYMAGFALATALLHVIGIGIGHAITRARYAAPALGAGIALAGAALLGAVALGA